MRTRVPGSGLSWIVVSLTLAVFPTTTEVRADETVEPAPAAAPVEPVSYWREVWPIFRSKCQGCHQPAKAGGKFVLTSHELLMAGSRGDPVIVPGKPDESELLATLLPDGDDPPSMPKDAEPLSETEIALIRRWISEGAKDDTPDSQKDTIDAEHPPTYENLPVVTAIDYSPDGKFLAVSGYHEVLVHKADGSQLIARLVGMSERVQSLAFSPDSKSLAVAGGTPGRIGEVQIWDVEKEKLRVSFPATHDTTYGVSWSGDGTKVAFGCPDNSVRAIDARKGVQVLFQGAHNDWVLGTTFSVDGSHLVSVSRDRSMKLIKVDTEQFIDNITSITPGALKGGLMAVVCHPKEDRLLVGGADGTPRIYRMHREKARKIGDDYNLIRGFDRLPGRIFALEFNADGSRIAACSSTGSRGEVRGYQAEDGKQLWRVEVDTPLYTVAYAPDGARVAVAGFDGKVRFIDTESGEVVADLVPVPYEKQERIIRSF